MQAAQLAISYTIAQSLLDEFEQQAPITRKFLERIPGDKLTWKPHVKSMTAGQLAYHLATIPGGIAQWVKNSPAQVPAQFDFPQPASREEVLRAFDGSIATVRAVLPIYDEVMNDSFRLLAGEKELFAVPRGTFLRNVMLNHWYQHRGQFGVYLRLLDIPVPASWGPSADEQPEFPPGR